MKILNRVIIVLLASSLAACSTTKYTTIRKAQDFDHIIVKHPVVAIAPAKAEIYKVGAFGKKTRMYEYEELVENLVPEILAVNLQNKGFKTLLLNPKDLYVKKLSQSIILLSENYNQIIEPLYKANLWAEEKAYNINVFLDQRLFNFQDIIKADYLIFIDYYANHNDIGANTLSFVTACLTDGEMKPDPIVLKIGIINLKNGQLVWTNLEDVATKSSWALRSYNSNLADERERIDQFIKNALYNISGS